MVFAEATQYPPWRHRLLCRGCAMVFMGGGKKSWLSTIFFVGRAFCSLPDTAFQPDQGLVLLFLGFRDRVLDRKSTRLNSSHTVISYAVFCLKKKKK